jgi:hypothetical protein
MATAIIRLYGGIGNQMYQYSFGFFLQKNGFKVLYDQSGLKDQNNHRKTSELSLFFKNIKLLNRELGLLLWVVAKIGFIEIVKENKRLSFIDIKKYNVGKKVLIFSGYWQNINYHIPENLPWKKFQFSLPVEPYAAIHVRRGDYVNHPRFICLTANYYNHIIEHIESNYNYKIIIVSNDINWAESNLKGRYISFFKSDSALNDWYILSQAKVLSIANSSFSLWAAIYGNVKNVIQPERWLKDGSKTNWGKKSWLRK